MEESHFQTSFIPKKPMSPRLVPTPGGKRYSANLLSSLSGIIFLIALAGAVGLFIWQLVLSRTIDSLTEKIAEARASFQPEVIERLRRLDVKLTMSEKVLASHTDPSGLFALLSSDTLRNVAFRKFTYTTQATNAAELTMSGESLGFATLALQVDVLNKNPQIRNPAFSHFAQNDQGQVTFDFKATLDPELDLLDGVLSGLDHGPPRIVDLGERERLDLVLLDVG